MRKRKNSSDLRIGVDIVDIRRIKKILDSDEKEAFVKRCFSESEISESKQKREIAEYLAGRFALKEALVKINGGRSGIRFSEITATGDYGRAVIKYTGGTKRVLNRYNISFSISHDGDYAVAVAIGIKR